MHFETNENQQRHEGAECYMLKTATCNPTTYTSTAHSLHTRCLLKKVFARQHGQGRIVVRSASRHRRVKSSSKCCQSIRE